MTLETPLASSDTMAQPDDMAQSTERLSPEDRPTNRTATEDVADDWMIETVEEEEGATGRAEGGSPAPIEEPTSTSAEEGKAEGGKKKSRIRQGFLNIKHKLFPRKKVNKLKVDKHGSQKSKSASNVLEEIDDDPTKMERAMSVDSVYPTDQRATSNHGMKDARSLEAIHMAALQSRLKKRDDDESPDTSATDMTQPCCGSTQSLGSMNSLENEAMDDFFKTNWTTSDMKRSISTEPKIFDLDSVSGVKLLENKEARQKINVKPKKTRPVSRRTRTQTASPQQKPMSPLPLVVEESQVMEPAQSAAQTPVVVKESPKEASRPVPATSNKFPIPEAALSPMKEVPKVEQPKEEPMESQKETEVSNKTSVQPKPKQPDELWVTQVRRVPSERIGKAVHLRENSGTPESKVKRRMVSSDGSSLEARHSAQLASMEQPFGRQTKAAETGTKTSVEPKTLKEEEQIAVQVHHVPSESNTLDVKLREKSDIPEDKTRRRISSDGGSRERRQSSRPISMQEPLDRPMVKKDDTPSSSKKDDMATSGGDTELTQMFNKLKQKSQKVKAPTDEKENIVLKTSPKKVNVITSPQKPPLSDTQSNVSKPTAEESAKVSAMAKPKAVFVIEKSEPKSSMLEPPASEDAIVKRSSPLLKNRARRQTLPVSPSMAKVKSIENEEDDASKVKRSASQRKQAEPAPATSVTLTSSAGKNLIRAATVVPKKPQSNEETPGSVAPWAAMALKKTSKFEQNMKLKANSEAKSDNILTVKSADDKPDPVCEPVASVPHSMADADTMGTNQTETKSALLICAAKPAVSNPVTVSSTITKPEVTPVKPFVSVTLLKPAVSVTPVKPAVSVTPVKPAVSATPLKPAVSVTPVKPAVSVTPLKPAVSVTPVKPAVSFIPVKPSVLVIPAKPIVSSTTSKPAVIIIAAKPAAPNMNTKPILSDTLTKPAFPSTKKPAISGTTKPSGDVMKTPGSTTVFAPGQRSKAPTSNIVNTTKNNDETKSSETILTPGLKENFSGSGKSRVLDMVKNWQNPQVAES